MPLIRRHANAVSAEHIGPIGKESDPPKPFCFALGAEQTARRIKTHQLRIGLWRNFHLSLQNRLIACDGDDQSTVLQRPPTGHRAIQFDA